MNLNKISEFVEAQETGSRSSKLLGAGGKAGINVISNYKKANTLSKVTQTTPEPDKNNENDLPCNFCGYFGHGTNPKSHVRNTRCPAFGKACSKCGKLGHFVKMCQQKKGSPSHENKSAGIQQINCNDEFSDSASVELYSVTTEN